MKFPTLFRVCMLGVFVMGGAQTVAGTHVLVPADNPWRYLHLRNGAEPAWLDPAFRALDWPISSAESGFEDVCQKTSDARPTDTAPIAATYFHKVFSCADPKVYTMMLLRVRAAGGAVVYLNGEELARLNMAEGKIVPYTAPSAPVFGREQGIFHNLRVRPDALRRGLNVLAVEVHQAARSDSSTSFDCELFASTDAQSVFITRGPYLQNAAQDAISIRWRTDLPTVGAVRWGATRRDLSNRVYGPSSPTTEHEIRISGLNPGLKYFYAVRSQGGITRGDTAQHSFRTLPVPGSDVPVRMWILGDSGTGGDGTARAERVRDAYRRFASTRPTDVWLMLGDNAYNSGLDREYQAAVFDTFRAFLKSTTLWPTLGNHDSYAGEPIPYFDIFTLPTQGEAGGVPSGTEHYYSFDYGPVHFVCLDSQSSNRQPGSPMLTWLESDLAATQAPWVIAYWHHPPYSHGSHNSDFEVELIEMRQYALPILEAYGVDLVLCGHSHSYERSMLIDGHYGSSDTLQPGMIKDSGNGKLNGDGPYTKTARSHAGAVYTVCGVSGQVSAGTLDHPIMVTSLGTLGSMVIDLKGNRLNAKFLEATGVVRDSFTILKP
jgi:hypothetical protein